MTIGDRRITVSRAKRLGATPRTSEVAAGLVLSLVGSALLATLASSDNPAKATEGLLAFAAVAALIWRFGLGVWVALLVLGSVDALPGPNLESLTTPSLH